MSSASIGVTKVEFVRLERSWVIRSPSCSTSRISRARSALSGQPLSISWSSFAARSEFPPACANRPKKARSLGTSENARGRNYHARAPRARVTSAAKPHHALRRVGDRYGDYGGRQPAARSQWPAGHFCFRVKAEVSKGGKAPWAVRTSLLAGWRGLYPGVCRAIAATGALLAPPGGFEGFCVVKEVLDPDDLPISEGEDGSQVGTQVDPAGPPVPPQSARTTTRSLTGKTRRR